MALPDVVLSGVPIPLRAFASSGLEVSYHVVSGPAVVTNGIEYLFGSNPAVAEAQAGRLPLGKVLANPDGKSCWVWAFSLDPDVPEWLPWSLEQTHDLAERIWSPLPGTLVQRNGRQGEVRLALEKARAFLRLRL